MSQSVTGRVADFNKLGNGDNVAPFTQGIFGEMAVSEAGGKYASMAYRGRIYHASTAVAGAAIGISTTTAPTFILWNPLGSGVNVVPIKFRAGFASGTGVCGAIGYMALFSAGAAPTSAVITAFTAATNLSCGLLGAGGNKALAGTAATIVTTTAQFLRSSGFSQGAPITSTAAVWNMVDDFDGEVILTPGTAIYPCGNTATAEVLQQSISWMEVPA